MSDFGSLTDPPATFRLVGARVVDPAAGSDEVGDLAVHGGRLVQNGDLPADAPTIDGSGLLVLPGLCDLHTHLREPGAEAAETIESGTRAAARGGFTTVCAMPNTNPALDEPARVEWVLTRGRAAAARVRAIAAATRGRAGESITDLAALCDAGAIGFSDDGAAVADARLARGLLAYLAPLGMPLFEHAEEPSLARGSLMRAGATATRLGLAGWPASAELTIVDRDIALAAETGARLHLTHLSTAASLDAVRAAKARGLPITCDVTPHHLSMTDAWVAGDRSFAWDEPAGAGADPFVAALDDALAYDGSCRVNPPLATREDALALLDGVADGTVDAIATDHAPHPPESKAVEFDRAAPGMIGLESALSIGLAAVASGRLTLSRLVEAMATRPAAIIGEERSLRPGAMADLVLLDPRATLRLEPGSLVSRSANTPLLGRELPGVVRMTVAAGRITFRDDAAPLP